MVGCRRILGVAIGTVEQNFVGYMEDFWSAMWSPGIVLVSCSLYIVQ